jgi:hypothetical protein
MNGARSTESSAIRSEGITECQFLDWPLRNKSIQKMKQPLREKGLFGYP